MLPPLPRQPHSFILPCTHPCGAGKCLPSAHPVPATAAALETRLWRSHGVSALHDGLSGQGRSPEAPRGSGQPQRVGVPAVANPHAEGYVALNRDGVRTDVRCDAGKLTAVPAEGRKPGPRGPSTVRFRLCGASRTGDSEETGDRSVVAGGGREARSDCAAGWGSAGQRSQRHRPGGTPTDTGQGRFRGTGSRPQRLSGPAGRCPWAGDTGPAAEPHRGGRGSGAGRRASQPSGESGSAPPLPPSPVQPRTGGRLPLGRRRASVPTTAQVS